MLACVHQDMKHAGSLESMKDVQELLEAMPQATLAS